MVEYREYDPKKKGIKKVKTTYESITGRIKPGRKPPQRRKGPRTRKRMTGRQRAMAKRASRTTSKYKKRLITRRIKTEMMEVVSRRGQPQIEAEFPVMKPQYREETTVSSTWIESIGPYDEKRKEAKFRTYTHLKSGAIRYNLYVIVGFPFRLFELWEKAHSKGTFYHKHIKKDYQDKNKIVRLR